MNNNVLNIFNQLISGGQNPQQIINNILMQNPQYQMIFNQIQSSGLSMKDYVLQYAKQNQIDIQPMLNLIQQKGYKL
jgi:hypothetical protein